MRWPLLWLPKIGASLPNELKRFEFIAYFVGAYVADVVFKSGRTEMSPEEIAMIVDRALDNLKGRDVVGQRRERPELGSSSALVRQVDGRGAATPDPR
jgi:hypothetical protein